MSNYKADASKPVTVTLTMPYAALVALTRDVGCTRYDNTKEELQDGGKGIPFDKSSQFDGEKQQVLKEAVIDHIESQKAEWNDDHYVLFKQLTAQVDKFSNEILEKTPEQWANIYLSHQDGKPYWGTCRWGTKEEAEQFAKGDADYVGTVIYKEKSE